MPLYPFCTIQECGLPSSKLFIYKKENLSEIVTITEFHLMMFKYKMKHKITKITDK